MDLIQFRGLDGSEMLSRGNSEASARLRRAKSSTSIKTRRSLPIEPEVSDPFIAKEQALAAAFHAYGRATMSDMPSRASFDTASSQYRAPHLERPLTRSKSIRFAGPTAQTGHGVPITMRAAPNSQQEHESRRSSLHPRLRRQHSSIQGEDGFVTALPSHGEYIETRVASQPSSFRRLRKSKSMFSPALLPIASVSSAARDRSHFTPEGTDQHSTSRLGRSFSFLRPNFDRTQPQAVISSAAQSEAVGLARDQYLRQLEQQRSNNQLGTVNAVKRRKSQKTFRKSVRTGNGNDNGSAAESLASSAGVQPGHRGIGGRARDLSSTFKTRMKRVFNRSSEEGGTLPAQQLRATRPHFGSSITPHATSESEYQPEESPNHSPLDHKDSGMGDTLRVPRRRGSHASSAHTPGGDLADDTAESRVTSWANSTATNTVSSQHASVPKRLSIIQENGGVPSRLRPLPQPGIGPQTQPRKSSLYAKLQQRIAKSNSTSPPQENAGNTVGSLTTNLEITSAGRGVMPEAYCNPSDPNRLGSLKLGRSSGPEDNIQPQVSTSESAEVTRADRARDEAKDASPSPKRPLRETKSMFFPQTTRIERSRTSPFRQAMQSSGEMGGVEVASSPIERSGKTSCQPAATRSRDRSLTRSESVYSRTSSGGTPQPLGSSTSPARKENDWEGYIATIPRKINIEDRVQASAAETGIARKIGHKKEHAETVGNDTDIGRLHLSTPMLKDSSAGSRIGIGIRPSPKYMSSQPMIDRFPLMSISPQANANSSEHQPSASLRAATRYTSGNENRIPPTRPDKGAGSSVVQQSAQGFSPHRSNSKENSVPRSAGKNDRSGLFDTPVKTNPLPALTPISHSRSSPERIARLRRMQSSNTMGSPDLRKDVGLSLRTRQRPQETYDPTKDSPVNIDASFRDQQDSASEGRRMVDMFLSNRKRPESFSEEETVFI
ncbi:MAG: hypothetical protein Q9186_006720 [Xanthomendoza sp. 1 TL-2023]